jgi:hypothetical protein
MKKLITLFVSLAMTLSMMSQVATSQATTKLLLKTHKHAKDSLQQTRQHNRLSVLSKKKSTQLGQKRSPGTILQQMDSVVYQTYNASAWVSSEKDVYYYNANGEDTLDLYLTPSNRTWVNAAKDTYTYDANGNELSDVYSQWDTNLNQWYVYSTDNYTYNANSQLTMDIYAQLNATTNLVTNQYEDLYTYDSNGNNTIMTTYSFDTNSNTWVTYSKDVYSYDGNNYETSDVYYTWDATTSTWVNNSTDTYAYDQYGDLISDVYTTWDAVWVNSSESIYAYDNNGNETSVTDSNWSTSTSLWVAADMDVYTVNTIYTYDELTVPQWFYYEMPFYNELTNDLGYTYQAGVAVYSTNALYYYSSPTVTGVISVANDNTSSTSVTISPNPTADFVQIRWTDNTPSLNLSIYNVGGQLVLQQTLNNNALVSVANLPAGLYIYNLSNGAKGKIIKE